MKLIKTALLIFLVTLICQIRESRTNQTTYIIKSTEGCADDCPKVTPTPTVGVQVWHEFSSQNKSRARKRHQMKD